VVHLGGESSLTAGTLGCRHYHTPHHEQVPLGMKSWATFHIVNDGYDNLELRFRLPADESHLPISIDFPEVSYSRDVHTANHVVKTSRCFRWHARGRWCWKATMVLLPFSSDFPEMSYS